MTGEETGPRAAFERARVVAVSACLLGEPCRYDAQDRRSERVLAAVAGKQVVPICPEELGGLGTPRQPAELRGGDGEAVHRGLARVIARGGQDVTPAFLEGARQAVGRARAAGAEAAILKERSPSCGCRQVTCDGRLVPGRGISTFVLAAAGIPALSDEEV